ncbi:MAG: VWA domain-containing protein [Phycisphaerales bacterium]|nr:VWA domain-containing protein [Phycisphaerales bacterium]
MHNHLFRSWLLILLVFTAMVRGDGLMVVHPPMEIAVPPGHPRFAPLTVDHHHVTVSINDQIAVTHVDQVFRNPSDQRLEATYLFPVPKGGQLDKFEMDVDGKMMEAELLDAGKARQIYEEIVRKARDPALLEYAGQDLIKVRIYPIEPRSTKQVKLRYTQLLTRDGKMVRYVYPLNTEKFSPTPIQSVSVKVEVSAKQAIQTVYSPSHAVDVTRQGASKLTVGFEVNNARPDTDFELYFSTADPAAATTQNNIDLSVISFNNGMDADEGGYFLMLASAPWKASDSAIIEKDVVFVVDTSGSMNGDKIAQARRALQYCLNSLNAGDRFEVIRFATESEGVFGKLVRADEEHRKQATQTVEGFTARGGTAIEAALQSAMKVAMERDTPTRPISLVFLTDGQPTVGARDIETLLKVVQKEKDGQAMRVFTFGIGSDVNTHLLDRIAQDTKAYAQYVLPSEDIEVKVSSFFARISNPVLTGVKLEVDGVKVSKMYPQDLPDLFEGDQLVIVGRYSGSGQARITLTGQSDKAARRFVTEAAFMQRSSEAGFIPRLWATRRVGSLLDQVRLHGENQELKDEITRLARQFGIVTPYTAFLIVEDETRREVPVAQRIMPAMSAPEAAPMREELYRAAGAMKESKAGDDAVANAQLNEALKRADKPTSLSGDLNMSYQGRAFGGSSAVSESVRQNLGQMQQQLRFVNGQSFYQNGKQWTDARLASTTNSSMVEVVFGSDEYFALLRKHPEIAPWLSLGSNLQFLLGDKMYQVVEAAGRS